jgi:hypothetical protein
MVALAKQWKTVSARRVKNSQFMVARKVSKGYMVALAKQWKTVPAR